MEEGNVKELVLVGGKCERIRDGNVKEIGGVEEIEIEIRKGQGEIKGDTCEK